MLPQLSRSPLLMAAVTVASVIVLFFLPLGVIGNAVGQTGIQLVGQPYEQYLQLVLQYPRTLNKNSKILKRFTIHGLWPSSSNKYRRVMYCNPQYGPDDILNLLTNANLIGNLGESWPNVYSSSRNLNFWTDEYNKHGSCALFWNIFQTPEAYFQKADELFWQANNFYRVFVDNRIFPGRQFDVSTYRSLVKIKNQGKTPRLQCIDGTGGTQLLEVAICYNKAIQVIDCPKLGNCTGSISYPREIAV